MDTQDEGLALEMGVQVPRPRRFFSPEYKGEVVELIRSTGKTAGQVARELDLTETAVREWVKRADLDAGRRSDGLTTAMELTVMVDTPGLQPQRRPRDRAAAAPDGQATPGDPSSR